MDMDAVELKEPVLDDDYPVYPGYLYVADGKVVECWLDQANVRRLKAHLKVSEIRRCDIFGRRKRWEQEDARTPDADHGKSGGR